MTSDPAHTPAPVVQYSRREWFQAAGTGALGLALVDGLRLPGGRLQAAAKEVGSGLEPLNRFPRVMQEYFMLRVGQAEREGEGRRRAIRNREDALRYVKEVRSRIQESFGPWPEKTPLNARITATHERDVYTLENVIFESRPGFLVTGNLYTPKGLRGKAPGVVGVCGHSTNGKAETAYQSFAQGLCRQGYVVFLIDPIGQGERLQYVNAKGKSSVGVGVREHLHAGNQQFLVGEFIGAWRAWDGMRALDYLLTRKEVDPERVGVTGNSGGGTMSTWLCGVEPRWAMGAPSCFVTTFRRNLENELPADTEQCPPRALSLGLDHSDFLAAMAPKPVIILAKEKDFFDARGAEEAYARLRELYGHLGAADQVGLFIGPTYHGYSQENREAMYGFFNQVTRAAAGSTEPALTIEKDETLWCAPGGQVANLKSRTVFDFTRDQARSLASSLEAKELQALPRSVSDVLRLPDWDGVPDYRILRAIGGRNYPRPYFTTYDVRTEPEVSAVVYGLYPDRHYSRPQVTDTRRALLYVSHHSADVELREDEWVGERVQSHAADAVFSVDLRGIGESRPNTCGQNTFLSAYGSDYFYAAHGVMLDYPVMGMRTFDLLKVLNWVVAQGVREVHLVGQGWGAIPAAFAGLLHPVVKRVTLRHALTSYQDIAGTEDYKWPLSTLVPDMLKQMDLPDVYGVLKQSKGLELVEPWDARSGW